MICTVKELGQCMQDLFPHDDIYEFENLGRVDVGGPELMICIGTDYLQFWQGVGSTKSIFVTSLFELQDWIVTNLL